MNNLNKDPAVGYLLSKLGLKNTIELVELALPAIANWEASFSQSLTSKDRIAAAAHAHKALGSVRVYGTKRLESLLTQILDKELGEEDLLQSLKQVCLELKLTRQKLRKWLDSQYV